MRDSFGCWNNRRVFRGTYWGKGGWLGKFRCNEIAEGGKRHTTPFWARFYFICAISGNERTRLCACICMRVYVSMCMSTPKPPRRSDRLRRHQSGRRLPTPVLDYRGMSEARQICTNWKYYLCAVSCSVAYVRVVCIGPYRFRGSFPPCASTTCPIPFPHFFGRAVHSNSGHSFHFHV